MAKKIKKERDITAPTDEFITTSQKILDWVADNWALSLTAMAGIVVIVGTIAFTQEYSATRMDSESEAFGAALQAIQQAFEPQTEDGSDPLPPDWNALAADLKQHEEALESESLQYITRFYRARALATAGDPQAALDIYTDLAVSNEDWTPFEFKIIAQYNAGVLHYEEGQYTEALAMFDTVVGQRREVVPEEEPALMPGERPETEILLVEAMRYVGRCHEALGDYPAAAAAYENTLRIAPEGIPAVRGLRTRIARLRAEHDIPETSLTLGTPAMDGAPLLTPEIPPAAP